MGAIVEYRGIEGLVAAEVIEDTTEKIEFGEVRSLAATSQLQKETNSTLDTHFYDNVPAIVIESTGADTVTVDTAAVELENVAWITGQQYDTEMGVFIEGERDPKYFAIGYMTEDTDGNQVFVWRLKGKFGIPGSTHKGKDNGTEANGQQLVFTGINTTYKFEKTGRTAKAVNVETKKNKVDVSSFFEKVQTPDTITMAVPSPASKGGEK